jgi:drug/metabolite transporter (DMT)-like permease
MAEPISNSLAKPHLVDVASEAERAQRRRGIAIMCVALLCFACLDASGKYLGRHLPVWEIVWARYLGASVLSLVFMNPFRAPEGFHTRRPVLQIVRACLLFASTALNFLALRYLQLDETMAIFFAAPLVISLLAGPMLGEWIGAKRLAAVLVGFLGVLLVVRPGFGGMHWAAIYSVIGLFCYAFYALLTRKLAASESNLTTAFFGSVSGVVLLTPFLPLFWTWPAGALDWLLLAGLGAFGGFGHYLLITAHGWAPAPVLAPYGYSQIVWMSALGFLVFGHTPGLWTLAGGAVVVASGLFLFYQERAGAR